MFSSLLAYRDDALRFSDVPRSGNRTLTLLKLFPTRPSLGMVRRKGVAFWLTEGNAGRTIVSLVRYHGAR